MTGRGKGGKGLGKGGAKRHRKVLRDNIQGITKPAIRRLARRGGVKRISGLIYEETRGVLKFFLENVMAIPVTSTKSWFFLFQKELCSYYVGLQHLRECLSNKRHGLLKAIEGVVKALLAVANLLLYYTYAPISEDLMLLKSTIYAFFFVSACVDLSVCVKLVSVWFYLIYL